MESFGKGLFHRIHKNGIEQVGNPFTYLSYYIAVQSHCSDQLPYLQHCHTFSSVLRMIK